LQVEVLVGMEVLILLFVALEAEAEVAPAPFTLGKIQIVGVKVVVEVIVQAPRPQDAVVVPLVWEEVEEVGLD
jgi:hypothetical protein